MTRGRSRSWMARAVVVMLAVAALTAQTGQSPEVLFERAQLLAEHGKTLPEAVALYLQVAERAGADRTLAAQALLGAADGYQKLRDRRARTMYERIVRDFNDVTQIAAMAETRLGSPASPSEGTIPSPGSRHVWRPESVNPAPWQYGRISRTGRFMPFTAFGDDGGLFVRDLTAGTVRKLVKQTPSNDQMAADYQSVISPDETQVAYSWGIAGEARRELRVISRTATPDERPRVLVSNPDIRWILPHDWSPDGTTLAVDVLRQGQTGQIALVSASTGAFRVLHTIDWRARPTAMLFSPDGRYVTFDTRPPNSTMRDIVTFAVDGSRQIPTVVHGADDSLIGWSSDGRNLLFESTRSGERAIWATRFERGAFAPARPVRQDLGRMRPLGITAAGSLFYVTEPVLPSEIMTAEIDFSTGRVVGAPRVAAKEFVGTNFMPVWSPDGSSLAYVSGRRDYAESVLVVRTSESDAPRELRLGLESFTAPRWLSRGNAMIVTGWDFDARAGLYRIDADTGTVAPVAVLAGGGDLLLREPLWIGELPNGALLYARQVARRDGPTAPAEFNVYSSDAAGLTGQPVARLNLGSRPDLGHRALSPDGRTIYYSRWFEQGNRTGGGATLVALDISTGRERTLFTGVTQRWSLSPDGRHILTGRVTPGEESSIWIVPVTGGEPRQVLGGLPARVSGVLSVLQWAPDGRSCLISWGRAGQAPEILWVPLDGRNPRPVDLGLGVDDFLQTLSLHPNGRRFAFHRRQVNPPDGFRTDLWEWRGFTITP